MPIKRIYTDAVHALQLEQTCAACKATNVVAVSSLSLGNGRNVDSVALPACACGATEFLLKTYRAAPTGMAAHRKVVNALAQHLKLAGQVAPEHAAAVAADKRVPKDLGELLSVVPPMALPA